MLRPVFIKNLITASVNPESSKIGESEKQETQARATGLLYAGAISEVLTMDAVLYLFLVHVVYVDGDFSALEMLLRGAIGDSS